MLQCFSGVLYRDVPDFVALIHNPILHRYCMNDTRLIRFNTTLGIVSGPCFIVQTPYRIVPCQDF